MPGIKPGIKSSQKGDGYGLRLLTLYGDGLYLLPKSGKDFSIASSNMFDIIISSHERRPSHVNCKKNKGKCGNEDLSNAK